MLISAVVGACSGPPFGNCTDELRVRIAPRDTTVRQGAELDASVALSTCGGSRQLRDTFTWTSNDPSVARVGPTDGRITTLSVGETTIDVVGARYGHVGSVRIAVTP
jgi:hypothetical protein